MTDTKSIAHHSAYMKFKYNVENQSREPKGFSPDDDYRIVERYPAAGKPHRFKFVDRENFELIDESEKYQIWKRKSR